MADAGVSGGQYHQRADRKEGEQPDEGRTVRLPRHHHDGHSYIHYVVVWTALGERDVHPLSVPLAGDHCVIM